MGVGGGGNKKGKGLPPPPLPPSPSILGGLPYWLITFPLPKSPVQFKVLVNLLSMKTLGCVNLFLVLFLFSGYTLCQPRRRCFKEAYRVR